MDGKDLVDLIIANLDKLSETTKRLLGICIIPQLLLLVHIDVISDKIISKDLIGAYFSTVKREI
ncbi:MAG: hypothetical protein QME45_12900 [Clostridiales bacterium]|nr:hypothetical protein [Clostridiales bacterium]